jgi:hypothetical protein
MIPVALAFIVGCGVCVVLGWVAYEEGGIPYAKGSKDELEHVDKSSFGFTLALPLFILATELTLRWNHIHGVDEVRGTGQIFPVVVSGFLLIRLILKTLIWGYALSSAQ